MLKSRLQKLDGLTHEKLKENIFKGEYNRTEKYVKKPSNITRKLKNTFLKVGVLNVQRCKCQKV